ncbi:cystathionine beta-synthase [Halobacteriovorax sp. HLS]|uniref:cystathionine beta-synthase n=1 Tax=Halobacteriovorax sp. HLS TaxID=2234000 RepID=UPI001F4F0F13|nr:cystathionine beta-synthase [Halobacteriovorax sp. HLS]
MDFIKSILDAMPSDWLQLTTHRLDIYNEELAKVEFLEKLQSLNSKSSDFEKELKNLPTAFDYIRLGHPLSCILEWTIAKERNLDEKNVISFSSQTMPILAILRKNLLSKVPTQILYKNELPKHFDESILKDIYGYNFELKRTTDYCEAADFSGTTVALSSFDELFTSELEASADFTVFADSQLGSVILVNGSESEAYISEIQHVRRRESIAMTPNDCLSVLEHFVGVKKLSPDLVGESKNRTRALSAIKEITNTSTDASLGSCGLSIQYAIMMGLIHHSYEVYPGKKIKFIVPPNCYGGTNDQARRVAACIDNVEILDLPVDGGKDMVASVEKVLSQVASADAIPFIIAEIPTNPRVEVPDLDRLRQALAKKRLTSEGATAVAPVFILDQTFCPNVLFLGQGDFLSSVKTISYVSGSKFPSGGLCTAGYCVTNEIANELGSYIEKHLQVCDNQATPFQVETLANQMPSMVERISEAYKNTRAFVDFIEQTLPEAKINFVSKELASKGFTPSVFSLDLPTKGDNARQREAHKRELNLLLIKMMINEIPDESKHCVSYGQLKGCYWTIPATSTQGTTKEGDKDYIVRVAISPIFDLEQHKSVFAKFCNQHIK